MKRRSETFATSFDAVTVFKIIFLTVKLRCSFLFYTAQCNFCGDEQLVHTKLNSWTINALMRTLKPLSNGLLYSNTVVHWPLIGWLLFWYSEKGPGWAAASPSPLFAVPNVTTHHSTVSVPTSYYSMWHYTVSQKTGPLEVMSHKFVISQHLLIYYG